jgi:hypothetical protein
MQRKNQYLPTAISIPGTAARFGVVSASEITTIRPSGTNQGRGDGDDLKRCEAQQQRYVPAAIERSAVESKDVNSRSGRLPAPAFLRAALLAHLRRTFR